VLKTVRCEARKYHARDYGDATVLDLRIRNEGFGRNPWQRRWRTARCHNGGGRNGNYGDEKCGTHVSWGGMYVPNKKDILMSHSLLYHLEWFRHELQPHVRDDGEEYVRFILDVLEERVRHHLFTSAASETAVVQAASPLCKRGTTALTSGVYRIVDGDLLQVPTPTTCRPHPHPPLRHVWSLPNPISLSTATNAKVRRRR